MIGQTDGARAIEMSDWVKIGKTAVAMTIIAEVVRMVEALLTMGYYTDPAYFAVWSKIMMPGAGPPPAEFYYYSVTFAFVTWFIFGFVYEKLGASIHDKNPTRKGLKFGALVFLLTGISGTLTMYLLVNLPAGLLVSWTISALLLYLIGGLVAGKLIKPT